MSDKRAVPLPVERTGQLPVDWQKRAEEAARRLGLEPPPEDDLRSAAEAKQRLREFEQEGGE